MKSGEILLRLLINYGSLIQVPGQRPNRILIKFIFLQSLGPKDSAHTIFKSGNYLYTVTKAVEKQGLISGTFMVSGSC